MRYVVIVNTRTVDHSVRDEKRRERISTFYIPAYDRRDAERQADYLQRADGCRTHRDGPFEMERVYEVGAQIFASGRDGNRRVVLTLSDLEMIASEYTKPDDKSAKMAVAAE